MNVKAHILIIDDSPINISLLGSTLETDYDVSAATSGQNALDFLAKHRPDLILLDIMMPEMDGYQLMHCLQQEPETANIPVIFVTAKSDEKSELEGLQMGAVDFISKPISPAVVKMRVKNHLLLGQQNRQILHGKILLESVFEAISDGVVVYDHNDIVIDLNTQMTYLWPNVSKSCKGLSAQSLFEQYLLPEIDEPGGELKALQGLVNNPQMMQRGDIQLTGKRYYRYFSAPLIYTDQWLGSVLCFSDITESIRLQQDLQKTSITDELTGLYNRRYFNNIINREIAAAQRYRSTLGALMLDIDFFKKINDKWGHATGDRVLVAVAKAMEEQLRSIDFCFRYGGEEFVVLLPNTNTQGIIDTGKRLMAAVAHLCVDEVNISISIGAASSEFLTPHPHKTPSDVLMDLADKELYRAKNDGRNRMFMLNTIKPFVNTM